jgi:hypothetical protein
MARIRKYKVTWQASDSEDVIGYKLYWSKSNEVDYGSRFIKVGNVTEIVLPDDVTLSEGPVMFGVTALDRDGNESDMALIPAPYHVHVPSPPARVAIAPSDEFKLIDATGGPEAGAARLTRIGSRPADEDESLARAIEGKDSQTDVRVKYYDDVGFRKM